MASNRKEHPMLVTFPELRTAKERWEACVTAVHGDYNMTIKKMCRALKCDRSWINRYVKPYVHYIYLPKIYLRAAGAPGTENTKYSEKEFIALVKGNITQISRQTIQIPVEKLIRADMREYFLENYQSEAEIRDEMENMPLEEQFRKNVSYIGLMKGRDQLIRECATKKGLELWEDSPKKHRRKETVPVACSLDLTDLDIQRDFLAVHDLKNYGDVDEEIYRDIFEGGFYRIVLEIPDTEGNKSQKIYYIAPLWELEGVQTRDYITVKYAKYLELFGGQP